MLSPCLRSVRQRTCVDFPFFLSLSCLTCLPSLILTFIFTTHFHFLFFTTPSTSHYSPTHCSLTNILPRSLSRSLSFSLSLPLSHSLLCSFHPLSLHSLFNAFSLSHFISLCLTLSLRLTLFLFLFHVFFFSCFFFFNYCELRRQVVRAL